VPGLSTILILGADAVAAAYPATPVQLVHACHRWGFSTVVPASWGDELIAAEIVRRCADRTARPVIQCSCPYVAARLGQHAWLLDDSVFWLVSPPSAVAKYLRTIDAKREIHLTYAGNCPGAADPAIDEHISAQELLAALSTRGIDPLAQPTVFEDIVPADRRRYVSSPGGVPEQHKLWEGASFRVVNPDPGNITVSLAQLLLTEDRLLVDCASELGCICRATKDAGTETMLVRSPTPIVATTTIDLGRPAPVAPPPPPIVTPALTPTPAENPKPRSEDPPKQAPQRSTPARPAYRRQSTWRRQSPRPGVVVARTSGIMFAAGEPVSFMKRPEARWVITAIIAAAALIIGLWAGRRTAPRQPGAVGSFDASGSRSSAQLGHSQ
jgi:hypothetical protein